MKGSEIFYGGALCCLIIAGCVNTQETLSPPSAEPALRATSDSYLKSEGEADLLDVGESFKLFVGDSPPFSDLHDVPDRPEETNNAPLYQEEAKDFSEKLAQEMEQNKALRHRHGLPSE